MEMKNPKKIGILGGTFNPIHYGHLLLAESARDRLQIDKVIFIPTGNNPYKDSDDDISSYHRVKMTQLAISSNSHFELSQMEINRQGYTYTVDTINELKKLYVNREFYFISGADIIFQIDKWKDAHIILENLKMVTTFRPGYNQDHLDLRIKELKELYNAEIMKLYTPEMDISSSEIRSRVKHGYSIKYLLPETVEKYIYENKLYVEP